MVALGRVAIVGPAIVMSRAEKSMSALRSASSSPLRMPVYSAVANKHLNFGVVRLLFEERLDVACGHLDETARAQRGDTGPLRLVNAVASSPGVEDLVGTSAISVVGAAGSKEDRERLLPLATHASEWMRLALVEGLTPTF